MRVWGREGASCVCVHVRRWFDAIAFGATTMQVPSPLLSSSISFLSICAIPLRRLKAPLKEKG